MPLYSYLRLCWAGNRVPVKQPCTCQVPGYPGPKYSASISKPGNTQEYPGNWQKVNTSNVRIYNTQHTQNPSQKTKTIKFKITNRVKLRTRYSVRVQVHTGTEYSSKYHYCTPHDPRSTSILSGIENVHEEPLLLPVRHRDPSRTVLGGMVGDISPGTGKSPGTRVPEFKYAAGTR